MKDYAGRSLGGVLTRAISVWGLLVLFVLLVIAFSLLRPDTFLTYFNIRSILSNKSVQLLVALSVFIPMVANQFDLSAGFNVGISQVLAIGLQGQGLPWQAAVGAVLLMGAGVGLANGLMITRVKIDSFIATLGTGTILYGLNAWYTGGQQVLASLPPEFLAISGNVWIAPAPAIYALVASLTLWVVFEYLPLGRYLYVLGASPRAAELNGISAKATSPSPSSPPERSPPSPASCCSRSFRSARAPSARNISCRRSPRRSSARRRFVRGASTSGGRCSPSPCSPSPSRG